MEAIIVACEQDSAGVVLRGVWLGTCTLKARKSDPWYTDRRKADRDLGKSRCRTVMLPCEIPGP